MIPTPDFYRPGNIVRIMGRATRYYIVDIDHKLGYAYLAHRPGVPASHCHRVPLETIVPA